MTVRQVYSLVGLVVVNSLSVYEYTVVFIINCYHVYNSTKRQSFHKVRGSDGMVKINYFQTEFFVKSLIRLCHARI